MFFEVSCTQNIHRRWNIWALITATGMSKFIDLLKVCGHTQIYFYFSIGLVQVDRNIEFNAFVQPKPLVRSRVIGSASAVISGWGASYLDRNWICGIAPNDLQYMNTTIMSNPECSLRVRMLAAFENNLPNVATIYPGHVCTFARRGVGICFGDSGSPLINDEGIVAVVVSGVLACARGGPDIFVRVSTYADWIDSYIQNSN